MIRHARGEIVVRRFGPLVLVTALLVVAALSAALGPPGVSRLPSSGAPDAAGPPLAPTDVATNPAELGPPAPPYQLNLPTWLSVGLAALFGVGLAVVIAVLLWRLVRDAVAVRRRRLPAAPRRVLPAQATREVVEAIDAGLAGLSDRDADPRRAVIACWVRLEQAAAAAGTSRRPSDTPTDLVARLLAAHRVSSRVLDAFAAVYLQARYATHLVDEETRSIAGSALHRLRAELAAPFADAAPLAPAGPLP